MRENTILKKLGLPEIRAAGHFERTVDEYGTVGKWVIDRGEWQALRAYPTIREAFTVCLYGWAEQLDLEKLTAKEQAIVRAVLYL